MAWSPAPGRPGAACPASSSGILGALIGGALARAADIGTVSGVNLGSIAIAALGSVLLLFVLEAIERR